MYFSQIAFIVVALICRARARGYGPITGGLTGTSRSGSGTIYGGSGVGLGGYSNIAGGRGGRTGISAGSFGSSGGYRGVVGGSSGLAGGYVPGFGGGFGNAGMDMSPKPYSIGYKAPDGEGGASFRSEHADGSGAVQGTYGYTDAQGLYRVVQYLADQYGFRATVNTNEPGVDGKENPADVNMLVEATPVGVQELYSAQSTYGTAGVGRLPGRTISGSNFGGRMGQYSGSLSGGYSSRRGGLSGGYSTGLGRGQGAGLMSVGSSGVLSSGLGAGRGAIAGVRSSGAYGSWSQGVGSRVADGYASGAIGGGYGTFSGIPRSTSGKSAY